MKKRSGIFISLLFVFSMLVLLVSCNRQTNTHSEVTTEAVLTTATITHAALTDENGFVYRLRPDGNSYALNASGTCTEGDIVIDTYNGLPVTRIDKYAFYGHTDITSITISENVKEIHESTFVWLKKLECITVDESNPVYHSDKGCLIETEKKTLRAVANEFTIPTDGSVTAIGSFALMGAPDIKELVIPEGVERLERYSISNALLLESVVLPSTLCMVEEYAFEGCGALESVTLSSYVNTFKSDVFRNCNSLKSIYVSDIESWLNTGFVYNGNILSENNRTFPLCGGVVLYAGGEPVKNLVITSEIEEIPDYAFFGYSLLESVTFSDSVRSVGDYSFAYCRSILSMNIPSNIKKLGDFAFSGCESLRGISIEHGVETLGRGCFSGCNSIEEIVIPDSVTTISSVFLGCDELKTVILSGSLTKISDGTFSRCPKLQRIEIPSGVTVIGSGAFWDCKNLTTVVIPRSVTEIKNKAFVNCPNISIVYEGTMEEWKAIERPLDYYEMLDTYKVCCLDGEIIE